jgi:diguanylate cyclase (GGDEF)-like protein
VLRYELELIADILGVNLVNGKLYRAAYRDPLTDLRARRGMEEALLDEHARSRRHGRPFSIVMLDVDGFKGVNDEHGHAVGDDLLRELAGILRAGVRTYDLVARYGGDEFTVVMPEAPSDSALTVAERLRRRVEEELRTPGGAPVTVSVGVATWSGDPEDAASAVVRRADAALYEAKRAGRNCIVASPAPVAEQPAAD